MIKKHEIVQILEESFDNYISNKDPENEIVACETKKTNKSGEIIVTFTHSDLTQNTFGITVSSKENKINNGGDVNSMKEFVVMTTTKIFGETDKIVTACRKAKENNGFIGVRKIVDGVFQDEFREIVSRETIDKILDHIGWKPAEKLDWNRINQKDITVQCANEQETIEFLEQCERKNINWKSGLKATESSHCYRNICTNGGLFLTEEHDNQKISFSDVLINTN